MLTETFLMSPCAHVQSSPKMWVQTWNGRIQRICASPGLLEVSRLLSTYTILSPVVNARPGHCFPSLNCMWLCFMFVPSLALCSVRINVLILIAGWATEYSFEDTVTAWGHCNRLTYFGSDFFIVPRMVNIEDTIKLLLRVTSNPAGVSLLASLLGFYMLTFVRAWRKDQTYMQVTVMTLIPKALLSVLSRWNKMEKQQ